MKFRNLSMVWLLTAIAAACQGADTRSPKVPTPLAVTDTAPPPSTALTAPDSAALSAPAPASFTVVLVTSEGEVEISVNRALAPRGADRLHYLASNGFFTGARFFRVVRGFVAQFGLSGIPAVDEAFDTRPIRDDLPKMTNAKGTLVFAKNGPNTRSTQLFFNLDDNGSQLDAQGFAPVGRITRGMDVVERLESTYGEASNQQGLIMARGNQYLRTRFPDLDSIVSATVKP